MGNVKEKKDNVLEQILDFIREEELKALGIRRENLLNDLLRRNLLRGSSSFDAFRKLYEEFITEIGNKVIQKMLADNLHRFITRDNKIFIDFLDSFIAKILDYIELDFKNLSIVGQQKTILFNRSKGSILTAKDSIIKKWNMERLILEEKQSLAINNDNCIKLDNTIFELPRNLVGYKDRMQKFLKKYDYNKNIFLMIRYRDYNMGLREELKKIIKDKGYNLVIANEKSITDEINNVIATLICCKFGIAIFDNSEDENDNIQAINPNVCYELGCMHSLKRETLILKDKNIDLHSDIISKLYEEINTDSTSNYENIDKIREIIDNWIIRITSTS